MDLFLQVADKYFDRSANCAVLFLNCFDAGFALAFILNAIAWIRCIDEII